METQEVFYAGQEVEWRHGGEIMSAQVISAEVEEGELLVTVQIRVPARELSSVPAEGEEEKE